MVRTRKRRADALACPSQVHARLGAVQLRCGWLLTQILDLPSHVTQGLGGSKLWRVTLLLGARLDPVLRGDMHAVEAGCCSSSTLLALVPLLLDGWLIPV